jgi:hypothetical protein
VIVRGPGGAAVARRADRRTALALVVLALAVYNLNCRVIQDGDTVSARLLPFALWRTGSLSLDAVAELAATVPSGKPYHEAYYLWRSPAGHLYTKYPVVTPVLLAPLYAPAVAFLAWQGWEQWRLQNTSLRMEKLAASLVAALSVGLFYLLARRRDERPRALLAAVAYGFATTTWVISSQALWLHGLGELLAVGALLAATAQPRPWTLLAAGVAAGLLAGNRPPDAALGAAQLCFYARTDFRAGSCYGPRYLTDALPFLVWLLVPVVARLRGWGLRAFILAVAVGIAIQAIGAFCYPRGHSDDLYYPRGLDRLVIAPAVWSPAEVPFLVEARAGVAPPELLPHSAGRR